MIQIFLSHSGQDTLLAGLLADLLKTALMLRASDIRCTSVEGHRLPAGADTAEKLRDELLTAPAFIGLISPQSLASAYVLFELGARWGAKKHLIPLLAPGVEPSILRGPIAGLNALRCDSMAQIHQLVGDLASLLGKEVEPPAAYQSKADVILTHRRAATHRRSPSAWLPPLTRIAAMDTPMRRTSSSATVKQNGRKTSPWVLTASVRRSRRLRICGGVVQRMCRRMSSPGFGKTAPWSTQKAFQCAYTGKSSRWMPTANCNESSRANARSWSPTITLADA